MPLFLYVKDLKSGSLLLGGQGHASSPTSGCFHWLCMEPGAPCKMHAEASDAQLTQRDCDICALTLCVHQYLMSHFPNTEGVALDHFILVFWYQSSKKKSAVVCAKLLMGFFKGGGEHLKEKRMFTTLLCISVGFFFFNNSWHLKKPSFFLKNTSGPQKCQFSAQISFICVRYTFLSRTVLINNRASGVTGGRWQDRKPLRKRFEEKPRVPWEKNMFLQTEIWIPSYRKKLMYFFCQPPNEVLSVQERGALLEKER